LSGVKGDFTRAAVVTIALHNIMWLHDVLGSSQVEQIRFLSHWDPYTVRSLEAVAFVHIVTHWSGHDGIEAYRSALTVF